ncbi:MAG: type IV pilus modification protein PilV [Pseudomonadota bacterium]
MNCINNKKQRGFSLVEVLIALVIMSVGMLGIAGLYVQSMQAGRTSMFRHHAVTLAGDVADRIRANPTAGAAYNHAASATGTNNNCVAMSTDCNPAEMAANDIFVWQTQADDSLPNGTVAVAFTAAAAGVPPLYQITVAWDEPNPLGGTTPSYTFTIPVNPI